MVKSESNKNEHDSRFEGLLTAPIFRAGKQGAEKHKVEIDNRFKSVLSDEKFGFHHSSEKGADKYGRTKKNQSQNIVDRDGISGYYKSKSTSEHPVDTEADGQGNTTKVASADASRGGLSRLDYLTKLSRGEIDAVDSNDSDSDSNSDNDSDGSESATNSNPNPSSDDSSSTDSDIDYEEDKSKKRRSAIAIPKHLPHLRRSNSSESGEAVDHSSEEDEDVLIEENTTSHHLAIENCDWTQITAEDIMATLQSFCSVGRTVRSVTIYPSNFGLEQMERESRFGPQNLWKKSSSRSLKASKSEGNSDHGGSSDDGDDNGGSEDDDDSKSDEYEEDEVWAEDDNDNDDDDDVNDDDDDDSFYDEIRPADDVESDDVASAASDRGSDDIDIERTKTKRFQGDFKRGNAVGVVLQSQLERRGKAKANSRHHHQSDDDSDGDGDKIAASGKADSDFDEIKLREYELSKLRYFFAIADCDSPSTANALYEALDGVELEHSSMVFDMKIVPSEALDAIKDRQVKDQCREVSAGYKPSLSGFVVNALQHTKVNCSWDEGEAVREKKLTNISMWRQLTESDFQQYLASENSSDSDSNSDPDSDSDSDGTNGNSNNSNIKSGSNAISKNKVKAKSSQLRKLLLGGNAEDDDDDNDDDDVNGGNDDFFLPQTKNKSKGNDDDGDDGFVEKSVMFVPNDLGKNLLEKKRESRSMSSETVLESAQRKLAEKRAAKNLAKKQFKASASDSNFSGNDIDNDVDVDVDVDIDSDSDNIVSKPKGKANTNSKGNSKGKGKGKEVPLDPEEKAREERSRQQLELMFADHSNSNSTNASGDGSGAAYGIHGEDYDMRAIAKKDKLTKKVSSSRSSLSRKALKRKLAAVADAANDHSSATGSTQFSLNLSDKRFSKVLDGDSNFGIDKTSAEFKETAAMREILNEQRQRKLRRLTDAESMFGAQHLNRNTQRSHIDAGAGAVNGSSGNNSTTGSEVHSLVNKLKMKFGGSKAGKNLRNK